jgi:hypothetical protein
VVDRDVTATVPVEVAAQPPKVYPVLVIPPTVAKDVIAVAPWLKFCDATEATPVPPLLLYVTVYTFTAHCA